MDDVFIRELVIFLGVCGLFIGTVPMMLRGHRAESIENSVAGSVGASVASDSASAAPAEASQVRVSKKRRAKARAASKKSS